MRRFTAYIFDLDGVLCHTDKFHFAAWAALTKKLDLPFDASVNDRLRGVSRMESLDIVLGEKKDAFTAEQKKSFAEVKNAIYRGYLQTMTPADLDEDVRSTLLKLRLPARTSICLAMHCSLRRFWKKTQTPDKSTCQRVSGSDSLIENRTRASR